MYLMIYTNLEGCSDRFWHNLGPNLVNLQNSEISRPWGRLISAKNEIATTGEPYKIQPKAPGYFKNTS